MQQHQAMTQEQTQQLRAALGLVIAALIDVRDLLDVDPDREAEEDCCAAGDDCGADARGAPAW